MSGPALNAIRWINSRPGESLAAILPDDRLITQYWPPDATIEDDRLEQLESSASLFYTDLAEPAASVTVLPAAHAAEMVRRAAGPGLLEGVDELCRRLGYQAPAIEQAAAYMRQHRIPATAYLRLLPDPRPDELPVALTCQVSLAHLREDWSILPEANLRIMSWYAPDDIPIDLLRAQGDDVLSAAEMDAVLSALATYALILLDDDAVRVHPLVQAVARDTDTVTPELVFPPRETLEIAVVLLEAATPEWQNPAGWPTWRRLLPHIDAIAGHLADDEGQVPPLALWTATANVLLDQGLVERALGYFLRALADGQRVDGPDHPDNLALRHNLGHAYTIAGDHAEAISTLEQSVSDRERVIGSDHPDTLTSRNSLATAYMAAGDHPRAIALLERTVSDRRRILGRRHPHTLASQSDLATAYVLAGAPDRAIGLLRKVIACARRINGADHPDVVIARGNLAYAYFAAGRVSKAIPLLEQSVTDHERVFGPDHPQTLTSRTALTDAREGVGRG